MRLHKRTQVVADANVDLTKFFLELEKKYELTYGEMFQLLADRMQNLTKYLIREERHPDEPGKGGDEA